MKAKIILKKELELDKDFHPKVLSFFEQVSNYVQEDGVTKKDRIKLSFSREEKQALFEFFKVPPVQVEKGLVQLNENVGSEIHYPNPFELMDLLRIHDKQ